jgi:hypothetical protein
MWKKDSIHSMFHLWLIKDGTVTVFSFFLSIEPGTGYLVDPAKSRTSIAADIVTKA